MWLPNGSTTPLTISQYRKLVVEIDEIRSGGWDNRILLSLGVEPEKSPGHQEAVPEPQVTNTPQGQGSEEEINVQEEEEAAPEVAMVSLPNLYLRAPLQRMREGRGRTASRRSKYGDRGRATLCT